MTQMTPLPCNNEIFKKGVSVAQIAPADGMRSWHIEEFVQRVARETQTQTDWHFSGGIAQVLTLGNATAVSAKIEALWPEFAAPYPNAMFAIGLPARCRAGVDIWIDDEIEANQMTGKKAQRRENRIKAAIAAGRKTFSQLREELWLNASQQEREDRYKFKNPGHRKYGMIGIN